MTPNRIYIGEYANYFIKDGEVFTHDNNKLSRYAVPEKVINDGAAGHPYGYVIGESGTLYMLLGDNTTVTKVAAGVKLVSAYWDWCVVVFKDGTIATYRAGVRYSTLVNPGNVVQVAAAHRIVVRTDDGKVWEYDWSSTPWKSGAVWYKSASVLASIQPKQVVLPGKATWVTTSRLFFSAAIVDGVVYAWGDSYAARYFPAGFGVKPIIVPATGKMTMVEASDHNLHAIDTDGFAHGQGGLGVGFVGDGRKEQEVIDTGGWPNMVVKTFQTSFVKISDRKFDWIAPGSSYKFRMAMREIDGTWNFFGYPKFGLDMTGYRPADDTTTVGLFASAKPMRREIPDQLIPKTSVELKTMGYPTAEYEPKPTRKAIATLYDDGTWENINGDD